MGSMTADSRIFGLIWATVSAMDLAVLIWPSPS